MTFSEMYKLALADPQMTFSSVNISFYIQDLNSICNFFTSDLYNVIERQAHLDLFITADDWEVTKERAIDYL